MRATHLDPNGLFGAPVRDLWLEIGFGAGEHLAHQARANPGRGVHRLRALRAGCRGPAAPSGRGRHGRARAHLPRRCAAPAPSPAGRLHRPPVHAVPRPLAQEAPPQAPPDRCRDPRRFRPHPEETARSSAGPPTMGTTWSGRWSESRRAGRFRGRSRGPATGPRGRPTGPKPATSRRPAPPATRRSFSATPASPAEARSGPSFLGDANAPGSPRSPPLSRTENPDAATAPHTHGLVPGNRASTFLFLTAQTNRGWPQHVRP